jgi:MFS family permease
MFLVVGVLAISWPLLALLGLADIRPAHRRSDAARAAASDAHSLNSAVYPLLVTGLLSSTAIVAGQFGTSLLMQMLNFSTSAISSTAAVGGLVSIPILPLFGIMSDRLGRRSCLTISYLLAAGGVVLLAGASQLWHFWAAATLLSIARAAGISVASAFVTDLLPRAALGRGLALVNTISWVAAFVGFAGSGYVLEQLGVPALFGIAAGL